MNALEVLIIVVAVGAAAFGLSVAFGVVRRVPRTRRGVTWIDHPGDVPLEQRPSEDDVEEPIPRRRLRGRPDAPTDSLSRR
jgi:hypothetical protein